LVQVRRKFSLPKRFVLASVGGDEPASIFDYPIPAVQTGSTSLALSIF